MGATFGKCFRFFSLLFKWAALRLWLSPLFPFRHCCEVNWLCWNCLSLSRRVAGTLPPASCSNSSSGSSSRQAYFPSLSRFSLQWVCLLCFILLFWNHTFTCFSVKSSKAAISTRLGLHRYLLKWNSFSSSRSCVLVYAVLKRRDAPPLGPTSMASGEPVKKEMMRIMNKNIKTK